MYLKKVSALSMLLASCYANAGVVDTIEAPTGFFLPVPAVFNSTYLRGSNQDWEWKHNAISGAYTTAELFISAYDVDQAQGEVDNIYAWDLQGNAGAGAWSLLGALNGLDDDYGYTTFNLSSPTWLDEINAGIMLKIDIDATNAGWVVALAKSVLTTDGSAPPPPNPGAVPVPGAVWLFGSAIAAFAGYRRKLSV